MQKCFFFAAGAIMWLIQLYFDHLGNQKNNGNVNKSTIFYIDCLSVTHIDCIQANTKTAQD